MKPEIITEGDKVSVKIPIGLDTDRDGKNSLSLAIVLEGDKSEVADEVLKVLLPKLPEWARVLVTNALAKA